MNAIVGANRSRSYRSVLNNVPAPHGQLLTIRQQGIRVATPHGLLDAQLIKILRIDHRPLPSHQYQNVPLPQTRLLPTASHPSVETPHEPPKQAPAIVAPTRQRTLPERKRTEVGLRTVGEVLTDYDGHLYEVRDQRLHQLGELVRDSRGRLFEVCRHPLTEQRTNKPLTSQVGVQATVNKSSSDYSLMNLLKRLVRSATRWFRTSVSST